MIIRADSRFAPSQWETSLQSNDVSHWLGTNLGGGGGGGGALQVIMVAMISIDIHCGWENEKKMKGKQSHITQAGRTLSANCIAKLKPQGVVELQMSTVNSLDSGKCGSNFKNDTFKLSLLIDIICISCITAHM